MNELDVVQAELDDNNSVVHGNVTFVADHFPRVISLHAHTLHRFHCAAIPL
jgi:hypothetical protein